MSNLTKTRKIEINAEARKKMGFITDILMIFVYFIVAHFPGVLAGIVIIFICRAALKHAKNHPARSRFDDNADW